MWFRASQRRFERLKLGRGDTLGGDASLLLLNRLDSDDRHLWRKGSASKNRFHNGAGGFPSCLFRVVWILFWGGFCVVGLGALLMLVWPPLLPIMERVFEVLSSPFLEFYADIIDLRG